MSERSMTSTEQPTDSDPNQEGSGAALRYYDTLDLYD